MKRGTLRYTEDQYAEQCGKNARWQSAANQINERGGVDGHATLERPAERECGPEGYSQAGIKPGLRSPINAGARAAVPDAPPPGAAPAPLSPVILLCGADGLPVPESEFYFAKPRRWRFDFAWPALKLALEIEGGIWTQGRHTRGAGALADLEKYSEAAILGWRIIYTTPREVESGMVMDRVRRALQ
jgi:hypothetical protein